MLKLTILTMLSSLLLFGCVHKSENKNRVASFSDQGWVQTKFLRTPQAARQIFEAILPAEGLVKLYATKSEKFPTGALLLAGDAVVVIPNAGNDTDWKLVYREADPINQGWVQTKFLRASKVMKVMPKTFVIVLPEAGLVKLYATKSEKFPTGALLPAGDVVVVAPNGGNDKDWKLVYREQDPTNRGWVQTKYLRRP